MPTGAISLAVPGHLPQHDPAVHACVRARGSGVVPFASADALYACFRDFGGWQAWKQDLPFELIGDARGTEVGALRSVVFARGGKFLHERLVALDDAKRTVTYVGLNYGSSAEYPLSASPFPGSFIDYSSTVRIAEVTVPAAPGGPVSAFMEWDGEVWTEGAKAAEMKAFLTAFYESNVVTLRECFTKDHDFMAPAKR